MNSLELSAPVFTILSALIEEKAGLHYGLLDRELLQEKASTRALEAGFGSLLDYYYFLRYDNESKAELIELVDSLVVNETYFFREWPSLCMLADTFLEKWIAEGRRPRIWSAACSTGEEPLSLAMLLDDRGLLDKVDIYASDISTRVVQRAKLGRFGRRAVRSLTEPNLVSKYLQNSADGHQISSHLTEAIIWQNNNLLKPNEWQVEGAFDLILCRNVLIYFSDTTVKQVLENLSQALRPDGLLMVGVSESLLRYGTGFIGEEHSGSFVYRKESQ